MADPMDTKPESYKVSVLITNQTYTNYLDFRTKDVETAGRLIRRFFEGAEDNRKYNISVSLPGDLNFTLENVSASEGLGRLNEMSLIENWKFL